jgi:anaerobic selenocysteine-containing dehydrogenase
MSAKNGGSQEILTDCTLCYHSCGCRVTVQDGKAVGVRGLESHPINKGRLCPKGEAGLENVYSPDRLRSPLKRTGSGFEAISWDQALEEIAGKLNQLKRDYGPQMLGVFSGSIGVENLEMAGLTQRFKAAFGSPNFFSVESVCYRMRIRTRQITFGKYPTEELDSNLYILWGHNPEESDFPLNLALKENLAKGAKLVVIDPKRIPLADRADMYLRIRPGTDGALALAMIHVIVTEGLQDRAFIEAHTFGFEKLADHIQSFTPEWAEEITWVPAGKIRELARLFAKTTGASIYQGTCTQDQTAGGTQNSRAFSVLQTITGNINVPGGWVVSPRLAFGNVGLHVEGEPLGADQYRLFFEVWGRKSPYGVVTLVPESIPDKIKAFYVVGGNPILSMADTNAFREAFQRLELLVVHDMFMTETAELAHYVLPACSHLEKWGVAYTYNVCHCLPYLMLRKKCIEPIGESRSEWWVFTELAKRLGLGEQFPWKSEEELVRHELGPTGLSFDYLLHEKPEGAFYQEKTYGISGRAFPTPSGKIEIYSMALAARPDPYGLGHIPPIPTWIPPSDADPRYPLQLCTPKSRARTHSIHGNQAVLARADRDDVWMHPSDAAARGLAPGQRVRVFNARGATALPVRITDRIAPGVVSIKEGAWFTPDDAGVDQRGCANVLTDDRSAPCGATTYNTCLVQVGPA